MKKILMFLTAGAMCFATACGGDDTTGGKSKNPGGEPTGELHIPVNVKLQHLVTTTFDGADVTIDGAKILEFLEMTEAQYYTAMGSVDVLEATSGQSAQKGNTLEFGVYYDEQYNFTPQTSNNFGHWFAKSGKMSWWANTEDVHYFYTENQCEFAAEKDQEAQYSKMFTYKVGIDQGVYDCAVGDKLTATEIIYDEANEKTVFIDWTIEIVDFIDPEAGKYDPSKASNKTLTVQETITEAAQFDKLSVMQDAFQLTKNEFNKAVVAAQIVTENFIDDVKVDPSAGGFGGVWFAADGTRTTWGKDKADGTANSVYFIELFSSPTALYVNVGFMDADAPALVAGKNFKNFKQVVTYTPNLEVPDTKFTCTVTYDLTF